MQKLEQQQQQQQQQQQFLQWLRQAEEFDHSELQAKIAQVNHNIQEIVTTQILPRTKTEQLQQSAALEG